MNWHEYAVQTGKLSKWPFEINNWKDVAESEVLVIGGGAGADHRHGAVMNA